AGQHLVAFRGNDLRIDMLRRAMNAQPGDTQLAHLHPRAASTPESRFGLFVHNRALLLLGFFTKHALIGITDAFAFVGLWRTEAANLRRSGAERLLVRSLQQYLGLRRRLGSYTRRQLVVDRMGEAQRQVQHFSSSFRTVADTHQLKLALKTLGDADNHVVHKSAGRTGVGPSFKLAFLDAESDLAVRKRDHDGAMNASGQCTVGALHTNFVAVEFDFDACRYNNRTLRYSGHGINSCLNSFLEHSAEHFPADASLTRRAVSHYAFAGGDNGDAQTIAHSRQLALALVGAQTRRTDTVDFGDNRLALEILQVQVQR